jgi:hypothetical protein
MLNEMTTEAAKSAAQIATVFVYGYSSSKNPFYKEARGKKLNSDHWSLLLNVPVGCGQKLLLMEGSQNPVAGEIVTMRAVDGQMFEVAVALTR